MKRDIKFQLERLCKLLRSLLWWSSTGFSSTSITKLCTESCFASIRVLRTGLTTRFSQMVFDKASQASDNSGKSPVKSQAWYFAQLYSAFSGFSKRVTRLRYRFLKTQRGQMFQFWWELTRISSAGKISLKAEELLRVTMWFSSSNFTVHRFTHCFSHPLWTLSAFKCFTQSSILLSFSSCLSSFSWLLAKLVWSFSKLTKSRENCCLSTLFGWRKTSLLRLGTTLTTSTTCKRT